MLSALINTCLSIKQKKYKYYENVEKMKMKILRSNISAWQEGIEQNVKNNNSRLNWLSKK